MLLDDKPIPDEGSMAHGAVLGLLAGVAFGVFGFELISHKVMVLLTMCLAQLIFFGLSAAAIRREKGPKTFWGFLFFLFLTQPVVLPAWFLAISAAT